MSLATLRQKFRPKKIISREQLLLKQFGLSKWGRVEMLVRGAVLSQFAVPIGSFLYWLVLQTHSQVTYQNSDGSTSSFISVGFKDSWDRAPIHIDNLLHRGLFAPLGTVNEPMWWVDARHDLRKVLIGFIVTLLIGAITVGFKKRERASVRHMALSVPKAFLAAGATAGILIWGFLNLPHDVSNLGALNTVPYVRDYIGSGQLELLVIGIVSGLVAKIFLARTFDTLQLMSIERNIAQGDEIVGWKKFLYGANYRNRYALYQKRVNDGSYRVEIGHPWIGALLITLTPAMLFLLGGGIWLLYFGPARGAAH
jgi:hypothetical protein